MSGAKIRILRQYQYRKHNCKAGGQIPKGLELKVANAGCN